jgi:hypothetical protein
MDTFHRCFSAPSWAMFKSLLEVRDDLLGRHRESAANSAASGGAAASGRKTRVARGVAEDRVRRLNAGTVPEPADLVPREVEVGAHAPTGSSRQGPALAVARTRRFEPEGVS